MVAEYHNQSKLRFWCQMVLPLVYDDSLSYMELLNKVVTYLNNCIQDVGNCETNIESLLEAFVNLQDYVNEIAEDISPLIEEKLDEMIESGEFGEILADALATVVAPEYDSSESYVPLNYAIKDGQLYCCTTNTTGDWDSTKWRETTIGDELNTLMQRVFALNAGQISYDSTETYNDETVGKELNNLNGAITQKADISLFKRLGIIGDSYACGEQYYSGSHHDLPTLSWGAMIARESGISAEIYAKGGQTVTAFLDSTDAGYNTVGYGKVIADKNDAYHNVGLFIFALGLNDANTDPTSTNVNTFQSNLATLIDNINTLYSNSVRIILLTFKRLRNTVSSDDAYNTAIINTATTKNVPVIDIRNLDYFKSNAYINNYDSSSHPTPDNYAGMAHALKDAIEATICGNSYFDGYRNLNVLNDIDIVLNSIKKTESVEQKTIHTVNVPRQSAHLIIIYGGGAVTYAVLFVTSTSGGVVGAVTISIGSGSAAPIITENIDNFTVTYNSDRRLYMYDFLVYGDFCYIT